jgi:sensor histidine kinase YesM
MNRLETFTPLSRRLTYLIGLNIAIGMVVALIWWLIQMPGSQSGLSDRLLGSLIDSLIYGLWFGLTMPYLAERLSALRAPWNWVSIISALLLSAVASTLLAEISLRALGLLRAEDLRQELLFKSLGVFFIALVIAVSVHTYEQVQGRSQAIKLRLRTQELEKERALKLASEARLSALEARLHPHFLFNTLNSISALIAEDPALAEQMLQRLSSLLRSALDASAQSNVTLEREIAFVTDYLEIEKIRFNERLSSTIVVEHGLDSILIPPFTLQPLVENSVKFAVALRTGGGEIRIAARKDNDGLLMEVWDDGPGFSLESIPPDHGLDNLRARLLTLRGTEAKLSVNADQDGTRVSVYLPCNGFRRSDERDT